MKIDSFLVFFFMELIGFWSRGFYFYFGFQFSCLLAWKMDQKRFCTLLFFVSKFCIFYYVVLLLLK
jgi:hypothetical protein